MNQPALTGFDWEQLEPETRVRVQEATERLHTLERRTGEAIIEIGRMLIDVKEDLGHGHFLAWLDAEFGWSRMTANRMMQVSEEFGGKCNTVLHLGTKVLYALAAPSTPEEVREEFIARAELGERITHKDVRQRLAVVESEPDEAEVVDDYPEPAPITSPPQRSYHSEIPINDSARAFSVGLIDAVAPASILKALADTEFKLVTARLALMKFPSDVVVRYGDNFEARESVDKIIKEATRIQIEAQVIRDQLTSGTQLRAVK